MEVSRLITTQTQHINFIYKQNVRRFNDRAPRQIVRSALFQFMSPATLTDPGSQSVDQNQSAKKQTSKLKDEKNTFLATPPKLGVSCHEKSGLERHSTTWLYRVGSRPPLTIEEEATAARDIQAVLRLNVVRSELEAQIGRTPSDEEWSKVAEVSVYRLYALRGLGRSWERKIVQSNSRLVHSISQQFKGKGMTYEDLCQEGVGGLLHGARKFDPSRSSKLSTYCYRWIVRAMQLAVTETTHPTRLGSYGWRQQTILWRLHQEFVERHRKAPSIQHLSRMSGIRISRVRVVLRATQPSLSLHSSTEGCGDLEDEGHGPHGHESALGGLWSKVVAALQFLEHNDREILRLSFGLLGTTPLLSQEVALKMNCHHITVRSRKKRAIAKLKALVNRGHQAYEHNKAEILTKL